jgi:hypothetical protein
VALAKIYKTNLSTTFSRYNINNTIENILKNYSVLTKRKNFLSQGYA